MGTQGMVCVVDADCKTVVKVVVGCEGFNAHKLARRIYEEGLITVDDIYRTAKEEDFGCRDCLVVMSSNQLRFEGPDVPSQTYRHTFSDPYFNPRWKYGTAEHLFFVDASGYHDRHP